MPPVIRVHSTGGLADVQAPLVFHSRTTALNQVKIVVSSEDCPASHFKKWFHYMVQLNAETNVDLENEEPVDASWEVYE